MFSVVEKTHEKRFTSGRPKVFHFGDFAPLLDYTLQRRHHRGRTPVTYFYRLRAGRACPVKYRAKLGHMPDSKSGSAHTQALE